MSIKDQYKDFVVKKISIKTEDLTDTERQIIEICFGLFEEKMQDIKLLNDEIKRISIENKNLKAYHSKE